MDQENPFDLTDQQLLEYRESFGLFNRAGDGRISGQELAHVMRALGENPTPAEVTEIIAEMNTDGSGSIGFTEFVKMMEHNVKGSNHEQELLEAFGMFDKNSDGFISAGELQHIMNTLGEKISEKDLSDMIREADSTGNGQINYSDFSKAMLEARK